MSIVLSDTHRRAAKLFVGRLTSKNTQAGKNYMGLEGEEKLQQELLSLAQNDGDAIIRVLAKERVFGQVPWRVAGRPNHRMKADRCFAPKGTRCGLTNS